MADDEPQSDESQSDEPQSDEPDEERSQYGGAPNDIDAAEQTERAEDATDEDES